MSFFRKLLNAREGSVLVLGALSLASVMGMSGLAVEIGNAWTIKVQRQRVADIAALGSALAYKNSQSQAVLTATAAEIAAKIA